MITVNMHEAKTRLSELVKAVEERNETVVLCRDGREVAEILRRVKRRAARNLTPDPRFRVERAPALLGLAGGDLPPGAAAALRKAPEAYVSVVSPWEVAKVAGGKPDRRGQGPATAAPW